MSLAMPRSRGTRRPGRTRVRPRRDVAHLAVVAGAPEQQVAERLARGEHGLVLVPAAAQRFGAGQLPAPHGIVLRGGDAATRFLRAARGDEAQLFVLLPVPVRGQAGEAAKALLALAQCLLAAHRIGHLFEGAEVVQRLAGGITHQRDGELYPDRLAVLVQVALAHQHFLRVAAVQAGAQPGRRVAVLRVRKIANIEPDELFARVAQDAAKAIVGDQDAPLDVGVRQAHRREIESGTETRFQLGHRGEVAVAGDDGGDVGFGQPVDRGALQQPDAAVLVQKSHAQRFVRARRRVQPQECRMHRTAVLRRARRPGRFGPAPRPLHSRGCGAARRWRTRCGRQRRTAPAPRRCSPAGHGSAPRWSAARGLLPGACRPGAGCGAASPRRARSGITSRRGA